MTRVRRIWTFALALVFVAVVWEVYKWIGPQDGGTVFGWTILPRASFQAIPHVWEMLSMYAEPDRRGSSTSMPQAAAGRFIRAMTVPPSLPSMPSGGPNRRIRIALAASMGSPLRCGRIAVDQVVDSSPTRRADETAQEGTFSAA